MLNDTDNNSVLLKYKFNKVFTTKLPNFRRVVFEEINERK